MADTNSGRIRSGAVTPEQRARDLANANGMTAGLLDFGGLTSDTLEALGIKDKAEWLRKSQAEAPGASTVGSILNPGSLLGELSNIGKGVYEAATADDMPEPKLISHDEFFKERRSKRGSLKDAQDAAEAKVLDSKAYQSTLTDGRRKTAQGLIDQARANAEKGWKSDQETAGSEDAKLEADYKAYTADHDKALEAYHGRDFQDRNPGLAKAFASGGPLLAAVLTGGTSRFVNNKTLKAVTEATSARAGTDIAKEARALDKVAYWDKNGGKTKAIGAGLSATVPLDLQAASDVFDRKALSPDYQDSQGNWQRSRAQKKAEDKLSDVPGYLWDNAFSLVSGGIGAGVGYKVAGGGPADDVFSLLNPPTPARLTALTDQRIAELEASRRLRQATADSKRPLLPPQAGQPAGQPQGGGAAPPQLAGPIGPVSPPNPSPNGGIPGSPGGVQGGGGQGGGGVPSYESYGSAQKVRGRNIWNNELDAVPPNAQAGYAPDVNDLLTALQGRLPSVKPDVLRGRAQGSVDQFNTIRASGGDPFSPAARASMTGGKEKLLVPLMLAGQQAAQNGDEASLEAIRAEVQRILSQASQQPVEPRGLLSQF